MLQIIKIGENTKHDHTFFVNRPHGHPVYLLVLVKTPARFFVDLKWTETPAGSAVVFKPGQQHLYSPLASSPDFPAYIDDWMHIVPPVSMLSQHFPFGSPILLHNPDDYYYLFHLIHKEFYGAKLHKNMTASYLTAALLDKLENESNTRKYPDIYYQFTALREEIYCNPQNNWNITSIANSMHISEGYFHSAYKNFFGTTCISDVINSRIQAAGELLVSTSKSVAEVAEACGYHNTEHFIRQFKRETGLSPSKYRKI